MQMKFSTVNSQLSVVSLQQGLENECFSSNIKEKGWWKDIGKMYCLSPSLLSQLCKPKNSFWHFQANVQSLDKSVSRANDAYLVFDSSQFHTPAFPACNLSFCNYKKFYLVLNTGLRRLTFLFKFHCFYISKVTCPLAMGEITPVHSWDESHCWLLEEKNILDWQLAM